MNEKMLYTVIDQLLESEIKREDAPASAATHFDYAVTELMKLAPGYKTNDPERQAVIDAASKHIEILSVNKELLKKKFEDIRRLFYEKH